MDNIRLIAGRSNPDLANKISQYLGIPLVKTKIIDFANSEIYVEIQENIRGKKIYFIQTGAKFDGRSVNDHHMEALQVADACIRCDVKSIGIIYAMFPYARSDKKDRPRVSTMCSVIANGLKDIGYSRIISSDIHSAQLQSIVQLPFDNLYDIKYQISTLEQRVFNDMTFNEIKEKYVLVSPDAGGIRRITDYSNRLQLNFAVMSKQRDYMNANTVLKSELLTNIDVRGKTAILIDDILDSGSTLIAAMSDLKEHGIKDCIVIVSHGIFSGQAIDRLNNCDFITKVITTNTVDQSDNLSNCNKLYVTDIAPLFGEVIKRITTDGSISELFV